MASFWAMMIGLGLTLVRRDGAFGSPGGTSNVILKEDGYGLLLENGNYLLME